MVEFGAVTLIDGAIADVATRVCRPRRPVRGDESRVHGLGDPDLAGAAPFSDEWERFARYRCTGVLAAHFSGTEHALLRAHWPCPRMSPDFLRAGHESAEWGPWIDTGRIAYANLPGGCSASLGDLIATLRLSETLEQWALRECPPNRRRFHCALYDAFATALLLQRLAREHDGTVWSLARVLAASVGDGVRRDELMQGRLF